MFAISPDMRKTAPIRQDQGRPHVLNTIEDERNPLIMAHPAQGHITVPADQLQAIANAASRLFCQASLLLDEAGVDTGATPPRPLPVEGNLFDLDAYRQQRRSGVSA